MSETVNVDVRRLILQSLESWHASGISHLTTANSPNLTAAVVAPAPLRSLAPVEAVSPSAAAPQEADESTGSAAASPSHRLLPVQVEAKQATAPSGSAASPSRCLLPENTVSPALEASPSVQTLSRTERMAELQILQEKVAHCTRCTELATTRTQTVFGVGNPEARLAFIGEAPGADEDAQGEPFVGRAGQLLNKIIEAMKMQREDIYICNVLRCRPPGNRLPLPDEAANCREYLDGQLRIVNPEYIVCWGSCASQNLLGMTESIGKLRKRFFQYGRAKVLCTYHPSYLLRNPAAKKDVWEDMKLLLKEMGTPIE